MRHRSSLGLLFILGTIALFAYRADDDPFASILKKMETYNESYQQEKVHLHLDKPYYAVGDDIWFKAYVINAQTSKPSSISGVLYVELINEKDSVKKQLKLPLISGITAGDFKLPESFTEGNYRIRAYTQWMKNAGTAYFFDKTIKVGNSWSNKVFTTADYQYSKTNSTQEVKSTIKFTDKDGEPYGGQDVSYEVQLSNRSIAKGKGVTNAQGDLTINFINTQPELYKSGRIVTSLSMPDKKRVTKEIMIKATSDAIDVQFFPEGGSLVENIPSKVGIKITNSKGLGEDGEGIIVDNNGQEINRFQVTHFGLGNLIVNPQPGKTYTAKIKFKDGSEGSYALPKANSEGYVLSVKNNEADIQVKVLLSPGMIGKGDVKLLAQHNGNVYLTTKSGSSKQVISTIIKKKDLPSGIIQLTLFSADNLPVCERLVFVRNTDDEVTVNLNADKQQYNLRDKVNLVVSALYDNKPVQGSFSVSVTNTAAVVPDEMNESNILTSLLLTSDIAGYVEKPNYYFLQNNSETRENLDNLMLTQGWRKFLWKDVISGVQPSSVFSEEKSLRISGMVTDLSARPIPKTSVSLYATAGGFFGLDTLTDAKGRFTFDNLSFPDSTKFIVQAKNAKGKRNTMIKMDIVSGQIVTKNKNTGDIIVNVNDALNGYLKQSENYFNDLVKSGRLEKSISLKEVTIEEKKKKVTNSSNLNGSGNADAVITAEQLQNCVTLSQCLQGRVAGLMIVNGIARLLRNQGAPMQIVIDGMYVDPDFLDNINPVDVETVEVLKSISYTSIYGSRGGGGVLLITTKRGGGTSNLATRFVPGIVTFSPKGYNISREFYSPKYESPEQTATTDFRSTIYWNPFIATNENGKAVFSYYNASQPGTYRVVLEGITMNGTLARTSYTYTVK